MKREPELHEYGGMWEESKWEVMYDEEVDLFSNNQPCKHCSPIKTEQKPNAYGDTYECKTFIVPRVVVAKNEGGCNTTGVCLDCILDAYK